jgi:sugar-specific transcriptional regulator TrmB
MRGIEVSFERITIALINLGLSQRDAEIYIYLATKGPQKARDIAAALKLGKKQLHSCLRHLHDCGLVHPCFQRSPEFYAVSFEKALDLLAQTRIRSACALEKNREALLSKWKSLDAEKR